MVTCPHCHSRGKTGPAFAPSEGFQDQPEILSGPQMPGTTKSLLLCRHCDGAFIKGPLGRARPVERDVWDSYHEYMEERLMPGIQMLRPFGHQNQPGTATASGPPPGGRTPPQAPETAVASVSQSTVPSEMATLSDSQKEALTKRLTSALDDVLERAATEAGIYPTEWGPGPQEFFVSFTRLLLMHAMIAHDEAIECGASSENLPYLQLLFGLRPALESAGAAWSNAGASASGASPMHKLAELAGPLQMVIGDFVDDDDVFIRVQKRIYSELEPPE